MKIRKQMLLLVAVSMFIVLKAAEVKPIRLKKKLIWW
ncbi:MAG: hypothetical protein H6Q20_2626 [Bacteroidetes bacterium]|nr:hypothetical protein [Bacteroidota bacterium]